MTTPRETSSAATRHTIGHVAESSGISARMIRHYESIGLIARPGRSAGNYRTYSESDVHTLRFVQRARALGFSMRQIAVLVSLWRNRGRASSTVRKLANEHIDELQAKIDAMQTMVRTLQTLAHQCHGDHRPDCPILDDLARTPRATRAGRLS